MNELPDTVREFDDMPTTRKWLYENTLTALQKRFPVEDNDYRLELHNPTVDTELNYGLERQKQALLKDMPLKVPVKGTWRLVDKASGTTLDEREDTIMHLPYLTERGTILYNGNEYSNVNQSRLKPGVYTRVKRSGELETFINAKPGTGQTFRVWMEPKTGVFRVNVGQSNVPIYSMLRALGMQDKDMIGLWGKDIWAANADHADDRILDKLYNKFAGSRADPALDHARRTEALRGIVEQIEVDPDVVARTLGMQNTNKVTPDVLGRVTHKLLQISRGEAKPDDRDAPMFSNVMSIEDMIPERIEKDAGRLAKTMLWKLRRDKNLARVPKGALNPYVEGYMFGSRMTQPLEETNPIHLLEQMNRVTKLGEGGIGSSEAITDEARDVNSGQAGFIDPITGPEGCWCGDAEVMTRNGWTRWDAVNADTEFACLIDGQLSYHRALELHVYDWDGPLYGAKTKYVQYLVTPKHRLWVCPYDDMPLAYRIESADYAHNRRRKLMTGGHAPYAGNDGEAFALPHIVGGNALKLLRDPIAIEAWAAFMGWYISEGCCTVRKNGVIDINIAQHDGDTIEHIREVLNALPFAYSENRVHGELHGFRIARKQLGVYLQQFGKSADKFLPTCLLDAPVAARKALLESLCLGDGRKKGATYTYCTSSRQLALDVERLAFSLGYSVRVRFEPDARPQSRTGGMWCVHLHLCNERVVMPATMGRPSQYFIEQYTGKVYCATVPGGLMYCRCGDYGGHWSGNTNIGIDTRFAFRTFKGRDRQMYAEFKDPRTGKLVYLRPEDVDGKVLAYPGEMARKDATVVVLKDGEMAEAPKDQVDLEIPSLAHMFTATTNLNPMPTGVQPARQFYGAKFWPQYMPQVEGEVPLVDSLMPGGGMTFSEYYGRKIGTLTSPVHGKVVKVTDDHVVVRGADGKTYEQELVKNFPFNRITGISYSPTVQAGDEVKPGDMLAHSNFTDAKTGALKLGRNLDVAIVPARGESVSGDTRILVLQPDGTAQHMPIRDMRMHAQLRSIAVNPNTWSGEFLPIRAYMCHAQGSAMCRVTTMDGTQLKTTYDHSFVTVADSGVGFVPIKPQEMVSGVTLLPVAQPCLPFGTGSARADCVSTRGQGVELAIELDVAFGQFVGLYLAEGCVAYRNGIPHHISIAATEPELVEFTLSWCHAHNIHAKSIQRRLHNGNITGAIVISSAALATWLASTTGRYAWGKQLPDVVWTAPADFARGIVSGYWSGDGTVSTKQCTATTTSRALADGVCLLLGGLGVRATYREYENGPLANRSAFQIHVFREHLENFPAVLLSRKQAGLELLATLPVQFSRDRIPIPLAHRARVRALLGANVSRGYMSRPLLRTVYTQLPTPIQRLVDAPLWWDIFESLTDIPGEGMVYDLDMQPLSNFMTGSGLVVHNSYEDAYAISEAAAKKLATDRLYGYDQSTRHGVEVDLNKYVALFPDTFQKEQLENLDEHGVVRPGTVLKHGDPIILAVGPKLLTAEDAQLGRLHKALRSAHTDQATIWEHEYTGTVTDAVMTRHGAKVNISAQVPVVVGDKLSSRYGIKGVVGKIYSDNEMPRNPVTNIPYDVLLNPMGILSRVAPNALVEMQLAKIAKATGQPMHIPQDAPEEGWNRYALNLLKQHGLTEAEKVFDPASGREIGPIATGPMYISAFHHIAEKKLSERGSTGVSYTQDEQPARGPGETLSAKRMSGMDNNALLSHGATGIVRDGLLIRGARNDEYWKALKLGRPLPEPKVPFIYDKFMALMKAGGINVSEKGNILSLMPMTDEDITKLSHGPLTVGAGVDYDLNPVEHGLFDLGKTGGLSGKFWTHVDLAEPMPNPVFEEPIRRLLGLRKQDVRDIIAGRQLLNGKTGGGAIKDALGALDIDKEITKYSQAIQKYRGANRDNAVKCLGYLDALKKGEISPASWVLSKAPVLPPTFRPVSRMGDVILQADLNELYRDLIETNNNIHELRKTLPEEALAEEKDTLYDALGAVIGLGDPITPEGRSKRLKGAIWQIIGDNPKTGLVQSKLLSKNMDVVGRGVVTPDPSLDMDHIGIPEDSAWTMYKDFVMRRLVRSNYPADAALRMIQERDPTATRALAEEMGERPVMINRAPTWHKFNILAFYPHIVKGDTLRVPPIITKGFNMDFDGDAVNFHVPISDEAVKDARTKLLPSKNLFSLTDLKSVRHAPEQEFALGLYQATREADKRPPVRFASRAAAFAAYRAGRIRINDPIEITGG